MSQLSTASTLPPELILHADEAFVEEVAVVDDLYFSSTDQNYENVSYETSDNDLSDSHFESDDDTPEENYEYLEQSELDLKECQKQEKFKQNTCGCQMYEGPCSEKLDWESILEFREHCQELTSEELDITINAELFSHRRSGHLTEAKKHKTKERERPHQFYFFMGKQICQKTFCFLHDIGRGKLQRICHSLDTEGLSSRVHKLKGKSPKHALSVTDREKIKQFLCKYARDNALPLPGRLPNFKNANVLLLPSDTSVETIYKQYESLATDIQLRSVSLRTFRRTWQELCPNIVVSKPCTDLCEKCQQFAVKISNSGNLSEEEKEELLSAYETHISHAKEQRNQYREMVLDSKESFTTLSEEESLPGRPPCSTDKPFHYSWDYAQQVHFPHHAQQVGPIYFKTPRKVNIFGMCSEGSGKQTFYLTDEANDHGKGANSVTSMAHHYFEHYGHGEKTAHIHFDNCSGQNKNNVVLWYGLWRVIIGLHQIISFNMMVAGHTKFEPDWHFGVWKVKWRNTNAETIHEVAHSVLSSSKSGHNIPHLTNDLESPVIFYDWKKYLSQYFKPLKHITKYHHFRMNSSQPGTVEYKEYSSSEFSSVSLLKKKDCLPPSETLPSVITAHGLDPSRQWYLYEQIRQYCTSERTKEASCPKPVVPKREIKITDEEESKSCCVVTSNKRKSLLLS